jgi:hypothetical protein
LLGVDSFLAQFDAIGLASTIKKTSVSSLMWPIEITSMWLFIRVYVIIEQVTDSVSSYVVFVVAYFFHTFYV